MVLVSAEKEKTRHVINMRASLFCTIENLGAHGGTRTPTPRGTWT